MLGLGRKQSTEKQGSGEPSVRAAAREPIQELDPTLDPLSSASLVSDRREAIRRATVDGQVRRAGAQPPERGLYSVVAENFKTVCRLDPRGAATLAALSALGAATSVSAPLMTEHFLRSPGGFDQGLMIGLLSLGLISGPLVAGTIQKLVEPTLNGKFWLRLWRKLEAEAITAIATKSYATLQESSFMDRVYRVKEDIPRILNFSARTFSIAGASVASLATAVVITYREPLVALPFWAAAAWQLLNDYRGATLQDTVSREGAETRRQWWAGRNVILNPHVIAEIMSLGLLDSFEKRHREKDAAFTEPQLKLNDRLLRWNIGPTTLQVAGFAGLGWSMLRAFDSGAVTTSTVVGTLGLAGALALNLMVLSRQISQQKTDGAYARDLQDLPRIGESVAPHDPKSPLLHNKQAPSFSFQNATVYACNYTPLLRDLDFEVASGDTVVVVGPSGAGKTTLMRVLSGEQQLTDGLVMVNGHLRLDAIPQQDWIRLTGILPQDFQSFDGFTMEETFPPNTKLDDPRVKAALELAQVGFLGSSGEHFKAIIGKGFKAASRNWSGGERQRVAIARVILQASTNGVMILDEPTAKLDPTLHSKILQGLLNRPRENRPTTFLVVHRIDEEMHRADKILVMLNGRIAQQGTHDELIQSPGWYRDNFGKDLPQAEESLADVAGPRE